MITIHRKRTIRICPEEHYSIFIITLTTETLSSWRMFSVWPESVDTQSGNVAVHTFIGQNILVDVPSIATALQLANCFLNNALNSAEVFNFRFHMQIQEIVPVLGICKKKILYFHES